MDPKTFFDSAGGVTAIMGAFAVPFVFAIVAAIIVLSVTRKRHVERMKMIEAGLVPPYRRARSIYGLLVVGAVFTAIGLALALSRVITGERDIEGPMVMGFMGLAFLGCFAYIRKQPRDDERPAPPPDTRPPKSF